MGDVVAGLAVMACLLSSAVAEVLAVASAVTPPQVRSNARRTGGVCQWITT
jgi:hypothetical protein